MELTGLSMDQAPPISAPLRFFLTAPLFGILAGLFMIFSGDVALSNRFSIETIIVVHAITIGFFSFVMLGAMTQMLPVLAGAKIPRVMSVVKYSHILLSVGVLSMLFGLFAGSTFFGTVAFFCLGSGFIIILTATVLSLRSVVSFNATIKAISTSVVFAFAVVFMGLYLLYGYIAEDITQLHLLITDIHGTWAVFGFCIVLVIGVSFQVLPMFYVAPKFKQFCKKRVVWLISAGLVLWLFFNLFYEQYAFFAKCSIALFTWAFATAVWVKLNQRKRPVGDITIWYWRTASIFLTAGSFLWVFDEYFGHQHIVLTGIAIGGGFLLCIMIGMMYKIIPFLVWFHLNSMGYMTIPTMNEMIDGNLSKLQFVLFLCSLVGFVFSFYYGWLFVFSAVCFILSMIILEYNIVVPVLVYRKIKKTKPDFDMSMFEIPKG